MAQLYSHKQNYPSVLPFRIRLSNGRTRTEPETFTAEELADAGYIAAPNPPQTQEFENLTWTGTEWAVIKLSQQQIDLILANRLATKWQEVRELRNKKITEVEWRIARHQSEQRLGIPLTESSIQHIDTYIQALRNITNQQDPDNIQWPVL